MRPGRVVALRPRIPTTSVPSPDRCMVLNAANSMPLTPIPARSSRVNRDAASTGSSVSQHAWRSSYSRTCAANSSGNSQIDSCMDQLCRQVRDRAGLPVVGVLVEAADALAGRRVPGEQPVSPGRAVVTLRTLAGCQYLSQFGPISEPCGDLVGPVLR